MAGVIVPQRNKKDALDVIGQALGIAANVYGIKTAYSQNQRAETTFEQQQEDRANEQAGIITPAQRASLAKAGGISVPVGTPDSTKFKYSDSDEEFAIAFPGKKETKEAKTRLIETVDPKGNPIQMIVEDKPGAVYAQTPPKEKKALEEANKKENQERNYRYNALVNNASKLKELVQKYGTVEVSGPEASAMDRAIYEMAIDYAKLVDPQSVAREGEVEAAKKYMLPFREWGGLFTSNQTAQEQIDEYVKGLGDRMAAVETAQKGKTEYNQTTAPGAGTAFAAPSSKKAFDPDSFLKGK